MFYLIASSALFGAVVFAIFSSGELQPWAKKNEGNLIIIYHKIDEINDEIFIFLANNQSQQQAKMITANESDEE